MAAISRNAIRKEPRVWYSYSRATAETAEAAAEDRNATSGVAGALRGEWPAERMDAGVQTAFATVRTGILMRVAFRSAKEAVFRGAKRDIP